MHAKYLVYSQVAWPSSSLLPEVKSDPCQKNLTTQFPVNNLKLIKKQNKINK